MIDATVTVDDNSVINANVFGIRSNGDATITLSGNNSIINAVQFGVASNGDATVILSGDDSSINVGGLDGVSSSGAGVTATLSGDNSVINANRFGISSFGDDAIVTLSGDNSAINAGQIAVGTSRDATVSLGANTRIIGDRDNNSATDDAILAQGGTIISHGLIQTGSGAQAGLSGDHSIEFSGFASNDSVTLHTGSNLNSPNGADLGGGDDTLTLVGNGSEDEVFLNTETVEVNADATGWALTSTSSFDDVNVNTGLFRNNGSLTIANLLTVDSGARFGGTGTTIGNVTNNGTLAPGNSVGTQVINGNFTQGAGATLQIEFDNTGIDLLDISGTANLDGTLELVELVSGVSADIPLTFLEADGGIAGTFSNVTQTFLAGTQIKNASVDVGATAASVTFALGTGLEDKADDNSGGAVADALENASGSDAAGVVDIANALNSSSDTGAALSSQSGSITKSAVAGVGRAVAEVAHLASARVSAQGTSGYTGISAGNGYAVGDGPSYWAQAVGGFGEIESDSNARGADYEVYGAAFGAEVELDEFNAKLGLFAGYTQTQSDSKGLQDTSQADAYQLGSYFGKNFNNNWHLSGYLTGAYLDFETERVTSSGVAEADFNGYGGFAQAVLEYEIHHDETLKFVPYAGLEGSAVHHERYEESGGGALNMDVDDNTFSQLTSEVGVKVRGNFNSDAYVIRPALNVGWAHQYLDDSVEQKSSFATAPSAIINSEGPEQSRDSARIGFDLSVSNISDTAKFYTNYDGDIASDRQDHRFTVGLKWTW